MVKTKTETTLTLESLDFFSLDSWPKKAKNNMKLGYRLHIYVGEFSSRYTCISHSQWELLTRFWEKKKGEHEKRDNINTWVSWVHLLMPETFNTQARNIHL